MIENVDRFSNGDGTYTIGMIDGDEPVTRDFDTRDDAIAYLLIVEEVEREIAEQPRSWSELDRHDRDCADS